MLNKIGPELSLYQAYKEADVSSIWTDQMGRNMQLMGGKWNQPKATRSYTWGK